jgi:tRNA 2-selenouridine synthase
MTKKIPIEYYFKENKQFPIIDVRSPGEFVQGHIPNAHNIPLFINEERAIVGTCYKKEGKNKAVKLGLSIVGPKLAEFVKEAEKIAPQKEVFVHCWRGGMRSGSFAWLLQTAGFEQVYTLELGYKAFRKFVLQTLTTKLNYKVIGGYTGSMKTHLLQMLKAKGQQVIDLEYLAHHKGSAFGSLGQAKQPTQEQFENDLAIEILKCDVSKPVWIEDESRHIGSVFLRPTFFENKLSAPLFLVQLPFEQRLEFLVKEYAIFPKQALENALRKIEKKLGGLHLKMTLEALENDDFHKVAEIALVYYDKYYGYSLANRAKETISTIEMEPDKLMEAVDLLIEKGN